MCQSPGYGSTQDDFIKFQNNFDNIIYDIISTLDLTIGEENICDRSLWSEICRKKDDLFSIFTDAM
jgi:hypothetical protein